MVPLVVISFIFKTNETNFNLDKNDGKENLTVDILRDGKIETLDLEEYIIGVVAAEMPASFEKEALKAQAVASRSYALFKKNNNRGSYDLTDDTNTQSYIDEGEMQKKWGSDYEKYYTKIKDAVLDTKGQVATHRGEIIEALYFSMSSGMTQDAEMVFGAKEDYLKSVISEYDNETLRNFKVEKNFGLEEFKTLLNLSCDEIKIDDITRNESDYVSSMTICDKRFTGIEMRQILSLRCAAFDIDIDDNITITTYGYGHGVGMSQYGANGYAKAGYTHEEILKHYYQNIEISKIT